MYYVIGANGSQYGPVDEATVRAWIAEGRVAAPSLSFKTGESGWVPLQSREEFHDLLAAANAAVAGAASGAVAAPLAGVPAPRPADAKEWLVALLLSIFLGTFGGCGIWWLIDVILIATNSLKDAQGRLPYKA